MLYVLRDKKTNKPLYLAYTIEGLKWATDSRGNLLFFEKARLQITDKEVIFIGNLKQSKSVYYTVYKRYPHSKFYLRQIEQKFYNVACKMLA